MMKIGNTNLNIKSMHIDKFLIFLLMTLLISSVSAITGSIGNARMILRVEQGDVVEKYILVKNVNNVSINIELLANGDLADYTDIKDKKFMLQPGEEKKAYFTIQAKKPGTTETKINVQFIPDEGNGVGLSASVIVIAEDKGLFDFFSDNSEDNSNEEQEIKVQDEVKDSEVNVSFGKNTDKNNEDVNPKQFISSSSENNLILIPIITTIILFLVFIVLLIVSLKINLNKKGGKIKPKKRMQEK